MLVLDHSGSMNGVLASMQARCRLILSICLPAGGTDLGLVTVFAGSTFWSLIPPKTTFQSDAPNVPALIGQLTTYNGATNTAQAMLGSPIQQLKTLNEPAATLT